MTQIPIAQIFSAAVTLLSALPGAVQALEGLVADIKGHPGLTDAQKADLVGQAKARADAEDDRVQAMVIPAPLPQGP